MAILNIINAIIFPVFVLDKNQMAWFGFIWVIIGIFSAVLLAYQLLKKFASEKINLKEINSLVETRVLGRKNKGLSKDGAVEVPNDDQNKDCYFAMFRDKYGIEWIISYDRQ